MPNVTMNDGMPNRTLTNPFSVPATSPMPMQSAAPAHNGHSQFTMATPSTAPESPSTEPTDRSMPPMMRTSVMPAATTASVGMRLARVLSVRAVRKFWLSAPNSSSRPIQMASMAAYSPNPLSLRITPRNAWPLGSVAYSDGVSSSEGPKGSRKYGRMGPAEN